MTPSCPSSRRRSSGRWRRLIRLQGSKDRTVKDSGTGGEGLGQMLAVLPPRAPGKPRAEGGSSAFQHRSGQAPGCQWLPFHPTNLPVGAWPPSPYRI